MLRSMTGFGAAAGEVDGVSYSVEARSVNNRYLKCSVKLPEYLSDLEAEAEQAIRRRIQRGTITLNVQMRLPDDRAAARINTTVLAGYLDQLRLLEVEANPIFRVDLAALLDLPGVCEPPAVDELLAGTREGLLHLVEEALEALVAMRASEGEALKVDLLAHCESIDACLAEIAAIAPQVVVDYQQRLTQRVTELTHAGSVRIDEDQLAREVAIFAERSDVAEEIARLRGHLEQFRQTVESAEASGRKLDFIAQEMLREANTIASKASNSQIARAVVEIKTAVDRIKEQAQNVE